MPAKMEHANITVTDPERTAALLVDVFGWTIRWKGGSKLGGTSIHVGEAGNGASYLALYTTPTPPTERSPKLGFGGLNHLGVVVDDLDATEARVVAAG